MLDLFVCANIFRVERTLRHHSIVYDCGGHSNSCLGDGVLLQQVSSISAGHRRAPGAALLPPSAQSTQTDDVRCVFIS